MDSIVVIAYMCHTSPFFSEPQHHLLEVSILQADPSTGHLGFYFVRPSLGKYTGLYARQQSQDNRNRTMGTSGTVQLKFAVTMWLNSTIRIHRQREIYTFERHHATHQTDHQEAHQS